MKIKYTEFPLDDSPILTCCQRACPAGTDVSSYIALLANGQMSKALDIIREENPFPSICGRVCDHECEGRCRRGESDEPVAIRALKRFLADKDRETRKKWPKKAVITRSEKVAVIGSGPAGLTAASDLTRDGFEVTVFESLPKAGGMMRFGIPDYRLPQDILDYDIEYLTKLGVNIITNKTLGEDLSLNELKKDGYKAVILATGAHGCRPLTIFDRDNKSSVIDTNSKKGIMLGIDFLRKVKLGNKFQIGKNIAVIGGGDVAMDTARTALRLGAKNVHLFCLEQRDEMPAHEWEIKEALDENIIFHCGWGPIEILGDEKVTGMKFAECTSVFNSEGKFSPEFNFFNTEELELDTIIASVGQYAIFSHSDEDGIEVLPNRLYKTNTETLQTSVNWIFAAGDAAYGTSTVIRAVASGHKAAWSVKEYLDGVKVTGNWQPKIRDIRIDRADIPYDWEERKAVKEDELSPEERVKSFTEVKLGLSEEAAIAEALRCMRCDDETKSTTYSRKSREEIYHLARDIGKDEPEVLSFLSQKLSNGKNNNNKKNKASFDDLIFLPANLTRLVIDPYREKCSTETTIGAESKMPMHISVPIVVGGMNYEMLSDTTKTALFEGVSKSKASIRVLDGIDVPDNAINIIRVVSIDKTPAKLSKTNAVELEPDDFNKPLDAHSLKSCMDSYKEVMSGIPVGVTIGPKNVGENIQAAVIAGLDFAVISAVEPIENEKGAIWPEERIYPKIDVLAEAVETLRAINREEDIELIYFGGIRNGADVARCLALGANAVIIGTSAIIAVESGFESSSSVDEDNGSVRLSRFIASLLMEASILARCCGKTNVHNLEPEDLRSLTVETSRSTGVPLVGMDKVYRKTLSGK
ncbi:MAG: FAD-dependent oxidoreductase [Armatimonadota bacterium]